MTGCFRQGDVWKIDFGEEPGVRPGVIVSRDELNRGSDVLVVPCTSSGVAEKSEYPNNCFLPNGAGGLERDSVAQTHLTMPVSKLRCLERYGRLPSADLGKVLASLIWTVDFFGE